MSISSEVVSVAIVLGTRAAQAANFGIPCIFCNAPYLGARLYDASSEGLAAMVTDGFTINDRGYKLASSMTSQEPHAEQILVYNRAALSTCVLDFTPLVTTEGAVYFFTLTYKGVSSDITFTVPAAATINTICDAIEILIDASLAGIAGAAVAPDNVTATKLTFTGATTGEPVQISGHSLAMIKLLDVTANAGIATDLAACAADYEFYRFVIDTMSEIENNAAAVWAEANGKQFFAQSCDSTNVVDAAGTGVGQDFFAASYNRSCVVYSGDGDGNLAACVVGRQSAFDPGTSAYHYKTFAGPAADALTATHLANAKGKNILVYALNNGQGHTFFGKAASGRSLRIQNAIDLLDARIREAVLSTFLSNEYIPMSDEGFALMQGCVRGVLSGLLSNGVILPGFTVTIPKASTLSSADLVAGILRTLKFSCTMPNDLQKVIVSGVVSF